MQFQSLENYRRDTGRFRFFAIAVVVLSLCGNVIFYLVGRHALERAYSRVWVIDNTYRPYRAEAQRLTDYAERPYEYEAAVREFYENAFTCDDSYLSSGGRCETLERALHLSVRFVNGQTLADYWAEEHIVNNVLEKNWVYRATVDSVLLDVDHHPVRGYVFGEQLIRMRHRMVTRHMHLSFVLYDVSQRTRRNPFAVKVDRLDIFNNQFINTHRQ